jgi:hypothetical protein
MQVDTIGIGIRRSSKRRIEHTEEFLWLGPLIIFALGLYVLAEIAAEQAGVSTHPLVKEYVWMAFRALPMFVCISLIFFLYSRKSIKYKSPIKSLFQSTINSIQEPVLIFSKIIPILIMPLMFASFGMLKMLMPRYRPFIFDEIFSKIDYYLFFGRHPWTVTHYLFGSDFSTKIIDIIYSLWVETLFVFMIGFALFASRTDRARFFLVYALIWILLGVFGAYLGSSAGPCFLHFMNHESARDFEGLMKNLNAISFRLSGGDGYGLSALYWQNVLWNAHASNNISFSMGISAMPSLHNAISVLYVLACFRIGKFLGSMAFVFAASIFVGSIHLGLHYAVDGIVAAISVIFIWCAVDTWLRRAGYDEKVEKRNQETAV